MASKSGILFCVLKSPKRSARLRLSVARHRLMLLSTNQHVHRSAAGRRVIDYTWIRCECQHCCRRQDEIIQQPIHLLPCLRRRREHPSTSPRYFFHLLARTRSLHPKTSDLGDRHFIIKLMLMRSYKSNLYVDIFVTIAFYCMYMCMNFVGLHSCV